MLKKDKIDRVELYKDRNVQVLLNKVLAGEIKEIEPLYDPNIGYRYPPIEAIVGGTLEAEAFMNRLYEAKMLTRKLYDKIIHAQDAAPQIFQFAIAVHIASPLTSKKALSLNMLSADIWMWRRASIKETDLSVQNVMMK